MLSILRRAWPHPTIYIMQTDLAGRAYKIVHDFEHTLIQLPTTTICIIETNGLKGICSAHICGAGVVIFIADKDDYHRHINVFFLFVCTLRAANCLHASFYTGSSHTVWKKKFRYWYEHLNIFNELI